jgi:SAM-dependent methyltransferase
VKAIEVYGGRPEQQFWQCEDCRMIYLFPPPSPEEEERFYKQEFEKFMQKRGAKDKDWSSPDKHFQSNQGEAQRRLVSLKPYMQKGMKVLEIGCSSGFMLSALKKMGLQVYGLDPSEVFVEYVRLKGIPVFPNLEELEGAFEIQFDLVLHYYVLEHIRQPVEFLKCYLDLLKKNGKMIFEVPCANDPLIELYRVPEFDRFYWSAAHHWYFNPESLTAVMKTCGCRFELYPEQRYDISNHMIWMRDGKPGGLGRFSHIFGKKLDDLYRHRLKESWYCDTIFAVMHN